MKRREPYNGASMHGLVNRLLMSKDKTETQGLVREAIDWFASKGHVMGSKEKYGEYVHAPFSLLPSAVIHYFSFFAPPLL